MDWLAAIWMLWPAIFLPLAFVNMDCCPAGAGDCGTTGFFACQSGTKPTALTVVISGITTVGCSLGGNCDAFNDTFIMLIDPPDGVSGCLFGPETVPSCNTTAPLNSGIYHEDINNIAVFVAANSEALGGAWRFESASLGTPPVDCAGLLASPGITLNVDNNPADNCDISGATCTVSA